MKLAEFHEICKTYEYFTHQSDDHRLQIASTKSNFGDGSESSKINLILKN